MRATKLPGSVAAVIMAAVLSVGCGNGDGAEEEQCPPPDGARIEATISAGAGGLAVSGQAGSVQPGATVTITDANGISTTVTAEADGSFLAPFGQSDAGIGAQLTITQDADGCAESTAITETIAAV
jgi:hypothetical protein